MAEYHTRLADTKGEYPKVLAITKEYHNDFCCLAKTMDLEWLQLMLKDVSLVDTSSWEKPSKDVVDTLINLIRMMV